jgi:1-deoxy-D-xylulose-5-phosphate synthase
MAVAAKAAGLEREHIAVIGDGALSAGMAFEALNHAGALDSDLLVILNDNEMSISPNVGALSKYLSRIWSGSFYQQMREGSKKVLSAIPSAWELARRAEEHIKGMIVPGTLFEELGFSYFGPIDGHDLPALLKILANLKKQGGPRLLHIITQKGKGYEPAENDACKFHGTGPFHIESGESSAAAGQAEVQSYTQAFSDWIVARATDEPLLHAITPAMREGSGLVAFSEEYPERFHDVAIAEQHAVTLAAGMAIDGLKPVVAIYSTFLQRGYDQLLHDVAIQHLDVLFAIDRAGVVGADGATHTGDFDIAYGRCIPGLVIMTPSDNEELQLLLNTGLEHPGPALVRYPRDHSLRPGTIETRDTIPLGQARLLREGRNIAILNFGPLLDTARRLAEARDCSLVDMRFVKPLDTGLLRELAGRHRHFFCIEDGAEAGGAGSAVSEWLQQEGLETRCHIHGHKDAFPPQGSRSQVLAWQGLDYDSLSQAMEKLDQ